MDAGGAGGTADGAAIWSAAHRSHRSQTVPDSAISRPHDAQRFTCLSWQICARAHTASGPGGGKACTSGASTVNLGTSVGSADSETTDHPPNW